MFDGSITEDRGKSLQQSRNGYPMHVMCHGHQIYHVGIRQSVDAKLFYNSEKV